MKVRQNYSNKLNKDELVFFGNIRNSQSERSYIINTNYSNGLPSKEEIEILIIDYKITQIIIENNIVLDETTETLEFLRYIRDCTSFGIRIEWKACISQDISLENLYHLYPPTYVSGITEKEHGLWKNSFEYGLLYYRQGPDFITIKDRRVNKSSINFTIGDITLQSIIKKMDIPYLIDSQVIDGKERAAINLLKEHHVVINFKEKALFLPYRIQKWM